MIRRSTRLRPAIPPLTPAIPEPSAQPSPDAQRVRELTRENRQLGKTIENLRAVMNAERVRHGKLESVLARYTEGLEAQLQNQTTAVQGLKDALLKNLAAHLVEPQR